MERLIGEDIAVECVEEEFPKTAKAIEFHLAGFMPDEVRDCEPEEWTCPEVCVRINSGLGHAYLWKDEEG